MEKKQAIFMYPFLLNFLVIYVILIKLLIYDIEEVIVLYMNFSEN